jgi:hypothetical protein
MLSQRRYEQLMGRRTRLRRTLRLVAETARRERTREEHLLIVADNHTRRRVRFLQRLPIRILAAIPLAVLFSTQSRTTIAVLLFLSPWLVFVVAVLGAQFSSRIASYDQVLREKYERLCARDAR